MKNISLVAYLAPFLFMARCKFISFKEYKIMTVVCKKYNVLIAKVTGVILTSEYSVVIYFQ